MNIKYSRLEADELLHLALVATQSNRHDEAIDYLKQAIEIEPTHAKAFYLLAAEHAQIGMYDRAIEEMKKSVELDPSLFAAHFQLGLLYLTSGQIDEALVSWKFLDSLGNNDPLYLFKSGLEAMANDRFDECGESLSKGILLNQNNPELNMDMQRILEELPIRESDSKDSTQSGHVFLSAYTTNDNQNN